MRYRIIGHAEDRIDAILLESARQWGVESAGRYHRLLLAAMMALGDDPALPGSRPVPRVAGIRAYSSRRIADHQAFEKACILLSGTAYWDRL